MAAGRLYRQFQGWIILKVVAEVIGILDVPSVGHFASGVFVIPVGPGLYDKYITAEAGIVFRTVQSCADFSNLLHCRNRVGGEKPIDVQDRIRPGLTHCRRPLPL